jgi:subtilisin family serine protease
VVEVDPAALAVTLDLGDSSVVQLVVRNGWSASSQLQVRSVAVLPPDQALPTARPAPGPAEPAPSAAAAQAVPGEWVVRYRDGRHTAKVRARLAAAGVMTMRRFPLIGAEHVRLATSAAADEVREWLLADPDVRDVEPNYRIAADMVPNDPDWARQWGLHNTGQTGGTPDVDIDAPEAWELSTGVGVPVGVLDTGVDMTHPDLAGNVWTNPDELPSNGVDDDNNGYVDDVHGWDFRNGDADPSDDNGHGTHVASIIAAVTHNGTAMAGVAWGAKVVPLKILGSNGAGSSVDALAALEYAVAEHLPVTNNSWGGAPYSAIMRDAIAAAGLAGSLCVAAAGNDGRDTDVTPHYPSSYDLACVVSVAATDATDHLASFSNFGRQTVDLAAPGMSIWSLARGGSASAANGTSMATPHVSGVAALILAHAAAAGAGSALTPAQVKGRLLYAVDAVPWLAGVTVTGGRLNAYRALTRPADWLSVVDTMGQLGPGTRMAIPVHLRTQGLAAGATYAARLAVRTNDPDLPVVGVPVSLTVRAVHSAAVEIPLAAGWNLVSWGVQPTATTIDSVCVSLGANLLHAVGFETAAINPSGGGTGAKIYVPGVRSGFNTLRRSDPRLGYWLRLSTADTLSLHGRALATDTPIPLARGYNLIAYLPPQPAEPASALASVAARLQQVIGFETQVLAANPGPTGAKLFEPSLAGPFNTLLAMGPRLGYWVRLSAPDTLAYPPDSSSYQSPAGSITALSSGSEPEANPLNPTAQFIGIYGYVTGGGVAAAAGTVVEVVDGIGQVAGRARVRSDGGYGCLPVYLDDPETRVDEGAEPGEWLTVRVNGTPTASRVQWTAFGDVSRLDLEISPAAGPPAPGDAVLLEANQPNPFNADTLIPYRLPTAALVHVAVYDALGRQVRVLVDQVQPAGPYRVWWDGYDQSGRQVASGVYFCRLQAGGAMRTRRLALVR